MARTKSSSRRKWCISIFVAAAIIFVIVIVVPLAVILPRKKHNALKANLIVPLYIYPTNLSLWEPLYNALEIHPTLNFTVIINPDSGPGSTDYPDVDYTAAVEKLSTYGNALMVGYVRTGYATRNISTVIAEVDNYAGWSSNSSALTMHGIFFDEAPYNYSEQAVDFMQTVNQVVKNSTGLHTPRLVLHNPGLIPDSRFDDNNTDVTVVFEHDYPTFLTKEASLDALPKNRSEYCYLINSVPTVGLANLTTLVDTLSAEAQYLFLTEETADYYQSFGTLWTNFTEAMTTYS